MPLTEKIPSRPGLDKNILIIDEDPRSASIIKDILELHGFLNVTTSGDTLQVYKEVLDMPAPPDLLICSHETSRIGGTHLIEALSLYFPELRAIITTINARTKADVGLRFPVLLKGDSGFFRDLLARTFECLERCILM